MGPSVDMLQLFNCIVGINLGGGQTAVAQQLLDGVELGPVVHEVGGEGMAQYVGALLIDGGNQ